MPSAWTVFVDTTVLLHAVDSHPSAQQARARAWLDVLWRQRCGRLSTQVLNEFYANAVGKLRARITQGDARAEVRRFQHWKPWAIDHQTVESAWAVEARYGLAWWDALIVAAAQHQSCNLLLSEELPNDLQIDTLRILNPFLTGPEWLNNPP